jgi:hypothetical protein
MTVVVTTLANRKARKSQMCPPSKVSLNEAVESIQFNSYLLTKGILAFTMVYSSLNWMTYRRAREEAEADDPKSNSSKKKKK